MTEDQEREIWKNIAKSFNVLGQLTQACVEGNVRSLIVYGPAGLGKSYTVEDVISSKPWTNSTTIKGGCTKIGLLRTLYRYRNDGDIIVFDDCDSVLLDLDCISLLKAALDSTERRVISYLSNAVIYPEDDETNRIPSSFEFNGTVIFITNTNFEKAPTKLKPHCDALVSRSHYIDLRMNTRWEYFVRIKMVVAQGLFDGWLSEEQQFDVVRYIRDNIDSLRELSVRMAVKIGQLCSTADNWRDVADVTCTRSS